MEANKSVSSKRNNHLCLLWTVLERSKLSKTWQKSSIKICAYHSYLGSRQKPLQVLVSLTANTFISHQKLKPGLGPLLKLQTYQLFHCSPSSLGKTPISQSNYYNCNKTFSVNPLVHNKYAKISCYYK